MDEFDYSPYGAEVSICGFHPQDPSSILGMEAIFFSLFFVYFVLF